MKILITQETDWLKRNPIIQHHLAEMLSLRGAEETLKGNVRLAIECYHLPTRKRSVVQQLVSLLECHGYRVRAEKEYIYADKV